LLEPLAIVNPFASALTFPSDGPRARAEHARYLTLLRSIALLHQHQRPRRVLEHGGAQREFLEVERDDLDVANRLLRAALSSGRDPLGPTARGLLVRFEALVRGRAAQQGCPPASLRLSRRELQRELGGGDTQLKLHLQQLVEQEQLRLHRGALGRFDYSLAPPEPAIDPALPLLHSSVLPSCDYDGPDRPDGADRSGGGRPGPTPDSAAQTAAQDDIPPDRSAEATPGATT
jgi:hypothetical protein